MKIPRDLYYILNRQNFSNAPWPWERSVEEDLERLVEKSPSFELAQRVRTCGWASSPMRVRPFRLPESVISFKPPARPKDRHVGWEEIHFEPFAFHTGNEQPLRVEEARKLAEDGEDLELMHIPVLYLSIPYGENFHTLTDRDFESVVGQMRKPVGLTWKFQTPRKLFQPPATRLTSDAAKKVEFLQECMVGLRIVDPGAKSKEEAVQAFSRLLNNRWFYAADNLEDFYWVNWSPIAPLGAHSAPGLTKSITTTFVEIPPEITNTAEDDDSAYKKAQIRVIAAHEGDRKPIPVAKNKALDKDTDLMQVPMGYIGWVSSEKRQGVFEQPVDWTWTEDWEEPWNWEWADGWGEPIELTWRNASRFDKGAYPDYAAIMKIVFLRHYAKMIYIVDTEEGVEEVEVVRAIKELAGIELRHSTNSLGQDYWWKVQYDGPLKKSSSRSSGFSKPPSRPGKDRSDPRVPSQTVVDLYGGDEEQAYTHWCNTN